MSNQTEKLKLTKPSLDDEIEQTIIDLGDNFEKIDTKIKDVNQQFQKLETSVEKIIIPKRHLFGGQLQKLKESLSNPLEQFTGIVFIGDSITWGRKLPENAIYEPRNGTLADPRDNFASASYVNEFKRYIGNSYAFAGTPLLSNWEHSPLGQSTVEYTIENVLYPKDGDFQITTVGTSMSIAEAQTQSSVTGYQMQLADGNISGTGYHSLKFTFTGNEFTLAFGVLDSDASYYDLYIDDVKIGTYHNKSGIDGLVEGNNQRRTHTFPYVRNKTIEIRTNRNGENVGNKRLRIEALIINKRIRITNQGINGATTNSYKLYNLTGNTFGKGEAVLPEDNFVFCQFGTNDRLIRSNVPRGSNAFRRNLQDLLDVVTPLSNVILMCANPVTNESTISYSFNMQRARDVIYRTAKENSMDMIDNYAIFKEYDLNKVTADGVHPNNIGMSIIYQNIVNSLENN